MQGLDQILGSSGTDLGSLGARFGLGPDQTANAMGSLLPAVLGGFQRRHEDGALGAAVAPVDGATQPDASAGNDVLGQIFGSKDASRQVADHAAGQSGVSATVLKAMLPIVAAMAAKHFATQAAGDGGGNGGGLGGILGSVLGGGQSAGAGGLGGGLGGLGAMLGGGNPLDAILGGRR